MKEWFSLEKVWVSLEKEWVSLEKEWVPLEKELNAGQHILSGSKYHSFLKRLPFFLELFSLFLSGFHSFSSESQLTLKGVVLFTRLHLESMFYILFEFHRIVCISATRCWIEMGFESKCSILNGKVIYIKKWKLNIADMWLIPLDRVTFINFHKLSKRHNSTWMCSWLFNYNLWLYEPVYISRY